MIEAKEHLHLHTAEDVATQLYNGYHFTDELIEEAMIQPVIEAKEQEEEMSIGKKMLATDMEMAKFPKGRKITNKSQVKKSDFSLKKGTVEGRKAIEEYDFKEVKPEVGPELPKEEFIRLTEKMFPQWANQDSKIANFMKELDPDKIYTKAEMDEYCSDKGVPLHHAQNYKIENRKGLGYGNIIKKTGSSYQLYPELRSEFIKYF